MKNFKVFLVVTLLLATAVTSASDQALLDILLENGVLNKLQYETLSRQAKAKAEEKQNNKIANTATSISKKTDWSSRVKVSGDMRFRHENIDQTSANGVKESRQRIRARLKIAAKINPEVDAGFRLVTSGGQTSANESLEGGFGGKDIFFDRAYIYWHPDFAQGLSAILGKFKQPWYNISAHGLIWDSDVNPEGIAANYQRKVGDINLAVSSGYFILEDGDTVRDESNDESNNDGFSDDLNMYHVGLSASMKFNPMFKGTLTSNLFVYNNETVALENSSMEIYEVAGKLDIKSPFLPLYVYAQYANNAAAIDKNKNTAWLAGFGAKYRALKIDYNYRNTEKYAVADTFNDSDFATGYTDSEGHKVKLAYKISHNFSAEAAYFVAKDLSIKGIRTDTLQLDLKAKF